jgi:hypothetical protein
MIWCKHSHCVVTPVVVTGIHRTACSGARGWLDTGDKPRYDNLGESLT